MKAGSLNLSRSAAAQTAEIAAALRARAAALLGVEASAIALAASPSQARSAAAGLGLGDQLEAGPAALAAVNGEGVPGLYRAGPDAAPVCVIHAGDTRVTEPETPPRALLEAALDQLRPAALAALAAERARHEAVLAACARRLAAETGATSISTLSDGLLLAGHADNPVKKALDRLGIVAETTVAGLRLHAPDLQTVSALAAWIGASASRTALVRRTTKETDIALRVDLDGEGAQIDTGVRFFDHMLEQVARHGGIGLSVTCEGDVDVDAHHTIEDVCLALGEALRRALGDKTGIGRYGFALPMDETRAGVWIDLSGRPFWRFDGEIPGERVSDFPVEMTGHCFRSIAESLKASIHVEVEGENAHHMIEGCFKAFGRALRQAVRIEDGALPSTKGAL